METRGYIRYLSLICTFYNDTFGYHILVSEGSSNMHIKNNYKTHLTCCVHMNKQQVSGHIGAMPGNLLHYK